jgi:hypothetical protein
MTAVGSGACLSGMAAGRWGRWRENQRFTSYVLASARSSGEGPSPEARSRRYFCCTYRSRRVHDATDGFRAAELRTSGVLP